MDKLYVQFHGFSPSEFTHSYINDKLRLLLDEAPYGATLKATYSRKGREFRGVIMIYSSVGRFFATAAGNHMKDVCNRLSQQMRRQLERWKSQRFQTDRRWQNKYSETSGVA